MITNFKLFESNIVNLYHGTGDYKYHVDDKYVFLTSDLGFAEDYGDKIYSVSVDLGNMFDSLELKHIQLLYDEGFKLTDPYISDVGDEVEGYDLDKDEYISAEAYINSVHEADTWESIESTKGVIPWIFKNEFDSILIYEGGVDNYLVKRDSITRMEQINK